MISESVTKRLPHLDLNSCYGSLKKGMGKGQIHAKDRDVTVKIPTRDGNVEKGERDKIKLLGIATGAKSVICKT